MIPFNRPFITGNELTYMADAMALGHLSGDGKYTKLSSSWLEANLGAKKALLAPSCTAALEMAAILANIQPGDEVIMPSYTFVSTANAFVLRGGVPIFVDIRADTLNIDENLIEASITSKTKAIVPVHYAGVACEMDTIMDIARRHNLLVIEDAAQAITSNYKGRQLGSIGHFGCLSFHETKNIQCGEGGALLINDDRFLDRAEIIREKGTNRSQFFRGMVDKYTWQDLGSSFLPSELNAAFLFAQLENSEVIHGDRIFAWRSYRGAFEGVDELKSLGIKAMSNSHDHNAHMFYLLMRDEWQRESLSSHLRSLGVGAVSHYVPLHSSPAGLKYGHPFGSLGVTDEISRRLVRLPLYPGVDVGEVISSVMTFVGQ